MNEEEIRLDQTKRVFDTLAELISRKQTCTYRCLIYDLLGFDTENYAELMSGLTITNALVEREEQQQEIDRLNNIINELERHLHQEILEWQDYNDNWIKAQVQEDKVILDKLKELKEENK